MLLAPWVEMARVPPPVPASHPQAHTPAASCRSYSPEQLYAVVANVSDYNQFVPWCQKSTVLVSSDPTYMEAEMEVGFQVFVER